jgi:Zn-dependent metalloprotease
VRSTFYKLEMCPILPTRRYEKIASNVSLPEGIRTAATVRMDAGKSFKAAVDALKPLDGELAPSSGNDSLHYRVYSMGMFMPDDEDEDQSKDKSKDRTEKSEDPDVPKHPAPGILVQDSNRFVATNPDGTIMADDAREKCVQGLKATYDLYKFLGRNSLDGKGSEIVASIHVGAGYGDAYWSPRQNQMFFGDGGVASRMWTYPGVAPPDDLTTWLCAYDLDTIGHELTHGVVQATANLGEEQAKNSKEEMVAGTLNESIADCFGMMVKHKVQNLTVDESDWDISPNWWAESTVKAKGWTKNYCRTFRKPEPSANEGAAEPKHMNEFDETTTDPHDNCGIPNHAFYLAAIDLGGYSWEQLGLFWYAALIDPSFKEMANQTFEYFAELTCRHARVISGPKAEAIVRKAWVMVGCWI